MQELDDFDLDIPFKGKRDYLHSTSLYDAVVKHLGDKLGRGNLSDVRLMFQGFARKKLKVTQHLGEAESRALMTFVCAGQKFRLDFVETEKEVADRRPYPEEQIMEHCHLDPVAERATLVDDGRQPFSLMECVVAINKALHERLFAENRGKWLFTEIRTARPLYETQWKEIAVQLKHRLGLKLTRATITLDREDVGYICFSLMQ